MMSDLSEFIPANSPSNAGRAELRQQEVGADMVASAFVRGDFILASGEKSCYFFDKYLFETKPTILRRLAAMLAERMSPNSVDRIAGSELGSVPLATAAALETGIPYVILRKGEVPTVAGELHQGERVILIEDVVHTGAAAVWAARALSGLGATVLGVVAVVDREEGARNLVAAAGYHFEALYSASVLGIENGGSHE